jgi:hypothetical protein
MTRGFGITYFVVLVLFICPSGNAQDTASLTGPVRDPTGAVLPKAASLKSNLGTDFFMRANAPHKARVIQFASKVMF